MTKISIDRKRYQFNDASFQVNSTKPYVLVVTFSINDNIKFSEKMNQGFKTAISRFYSNRSEIVTQPKKQQF